MSTDLNKAVNNWLFDVINIFKRDNEAPAAPKIGDIYDIDIPSPRQWFCYAC